MTTEEYESLSQLATLKSSDVQSSKEFDTNVDDDGNQKMNGKTSESSLSVKTSDDDLIQPLNLRMLQGAFIALLFGYGMAGIIFKSYYIFEFIIL